MRAHLVPRDARRATDLRLLAASRMCDALGAGLAHPVLPLLVSVRLGMSGLGLVFTVASLALMLRRPTASVLPDWLSRGWPLVAASLVTALLVPPLAMCGQPLALAAVLALRVLLARGAAPLSLVDDDEASDTERRTAIARFDRGATVMYFAGQLASATVVYLCGAERVFLISGELFLAAGILATLVGAPCCADGGDGDATVPEADDHR